MSVLSSPFGHVHVPDNISLPEYILSNTEKSGDSTAFIEASTGNIITFRELSKTIRSFASILTRRRLQKGDRVLIFSPNHMQYCAAIYGAAYAGAIVATINNNYTSSELKYMVGDCEPVYIITTQKLINTVLEAVKGHHALKDIILLSGEHEGCLSFETLIREGDPEHVSRIQINPREDVIFLPYSSGTTGRSKGVMMTHYNMVAMTTIFKNFVKPISGSSHVYLMFLPFYHIYALGVIMGFALHKGSSQVVMETFDFDLFLKYIVKYKVTAVPLVPPVAVLLAKDPRTRQYDLTGVQTIMSGAAPMDATLEQEVLTATGAQDLRQGWGMTETPCAMVNPVGGNKPGTCGKPIQNTEAMVVDVTTREPLGPNNDGELVIRGPQVMKGYWGRPQATAETFTKDGWLLTGDIARYDNEGYISVVDRLKELIKWKGLQVPPADLEFLILKHPDVADVAVIGVPDVEAGELPRAYVVRKPGLKTTEKTIIDYVAKNVSPHKRLRGGVEFIDEIPKSPSGKILRRVLKERLKQPPKAKY